MYSKILYKNLLKLLVCKGKEANRKLYYFYVELKKRLKIQINLNIVYS